MPREGGASSKPRPFRPRCLWNTGSPAGACHRAAIRPTRWRVTTSEYGFAFSRRVSPEVCIFVCPPRNQRAQGRPGARCTRGLVCNSAQKTRTRAYRFSGNTPAFPAQWLYGLLRALPGGAGLLSPSPAETSDRLSASIAAPGPHDLAVRFGVFVRCEKIHLTPKRPSPPQPYAS